MPNVSTSTALVTDQVLPAHAATLDALKAAAARNAELWRSVRNPGEAVPGLVWSAAETAAHVVGDLGDCVQTLTRPGDGDDRAVDTAQPALRQSEINAGHLQRVVQRDMCQLADLLEETIATYLTSAASADPRTPIRIPSGVAMLPATLSCVLLSEQLVHGLDIARAANASWSISAAEALLVIPGVLSLAPQFLRPSAARVQASYELRMRGGPRYKLAVDKGTAVVSAAHDKSECVITADPVAFLLVSSHRIPPWAPALSGKIRVSGRKPWLMLKFGSLLDTP